MGERSSDAISVNQPAKLACSLPPPGQVPILIDGDTKLVESLVICDYLDAQYPSPPLLPADAATAAKVRLFVDAFSAQFVPAIFGLYRADTPEAVAAGKAKLEAALKVGAAGWLGGAWGMRRVLACVVERHQAVESLPGDLVRLLPKPSHRPAGPPHTGVLLYRCCSCCCRALQVLDAFLVLHGSEEGGHLFLGGRYSMAETACTSLLQRGVVTLPAYRAIDLWELVRSHKLER